MLTSILLLLAAQAAVPDNVQTLPVGEPDPAHMNAKEMREFNASLPPAHPYHIRCRREVETGSLARTTRICRTNQQWTKADQVGNANVRETMDRMSSKYQDGETTAYEITSPP